MPSRGWAASLPLPLGRAVRPHGARGTGSGRAGPVPGRCSPVADANPGCPARGPSPTGSEPRPDPSPGPCGPLRHAPWAALNFLGNCTSMAGHTAASFSTNPRHRGLPSNSPARDWLSKQPAAGPTLAPPVAPRGTPPRQGELGRDPGLAGCARDGCTPRPRPAACDQRSRGWPPRR